jgi:uncharacterized RDD family membrane protein YckC
VLVLIAITLGMSFATGVEFLEVTTRSFQSGDFQSISVFATPTPIAWLATFAYFTLQWALLGRTLGMMPFRLRILRSTDGSRLGPLRVVLRFVGLVVSFAVLFIGVIWVAADSRKQGWHDKMAGSVVVQPAPAVQGASAAEAAGTQGIP